LTLVGAAYVSGVLLLEVLAGLVILFLAREFVLGKQTGVDSMNKTNQMTGYTFSVVDTFWAIGCSGVANALAA